MRITSKPTVYRGLLFRSKLEVEWAKFFDDKGIPWEYEKQSFDFGDGTGYLPDFWLPNHAIWGEVKPERLDKEALSKANKLVLKTGSSIALLEGCPSTVMYRMISINPHVGEDETLVMGSICFADNSWVFPKLVRKHTEPFVIGKGESSQKLSLKKRVLAR